MFHPPGSQQCQIFMLFVLRMLSTILRKRGQRPEESKSASRAFLRRQSQRLKNDATEETANGKGLEKLEKTGPAIGIEPASSLDGIDPDKGKTANGHDATQPPAEPEEPPSKDHDPPHEESGTNHQNGHQVLSVEHVARTDTHSPDGPIHERVLAVIVHRTDRIKSKTYIIHPLVKVHVINANTGEFTKKSHRQRAVAYANEMGVRTEAVDYILPLMTKPSQFRAQDLPSPTWEELLLFNDEFDHFVDPANNVMLMFEILDFKSMSSAKRDASSTIRTPTQPDECISDDRTGGWHRIAWAFLKLVSSSGGLNTGSNLRLQLYKAPITTKLRDERQPEVYHWWKYVPRVKYAGTLFVTVKSVDCPRNVPPSSRSMYAVQKESITPSTSMNQDTIETGRTEEDGNLEEEQYSWSRLPGQPCKVPNKVMFTLPCGRGGCFRLKFSANGKYLAGAGAELQTNKFPIYVYGFPGGKFMGILHGHLQLVYELFWNPTDLLLSASADCTVRLWNVANMRCCTILTHSTFVYCARFHPADDNLIFTGAFDKKIRLWSLKADHKKPMVIQEFESHSNYVNCLCFTEDSRFLYSGDGAGTIRIWASADETGESWMFLKEIKEDRLMGKPINALEVHQDQKRLFIQSRDGCVRALELRSLALRGHYRGLRNADTHVRGDLTPCGTLYFAGDGDGSAIVWHVQSGLKYAEYKQLSLAQYPVPCISYHPFDHWVAFAIYGLRQPVLVYKHDSSVPELHKEEAQPKPIEKKEGPTFDPDYSLAKLLEEHRLLTKIDLPTGTWSASRKTAIIPKSSSMGNLRGMESSKKESQISDTGSGTSKRVTFDVNVQNTGTPGQKRRALFAHRESSQQSTLMEVPLEKSTRESLNSNDDTAILEPSVARSFEVVHEERAGHSLPTQQKIQHVQESVLETSLSAKSSGPQPEPVLVSSKGAIGQVRAKYSYKAQNDDEISFQKGDTIKVIRQDELWWVGYVNPETIGYFPANYVSEMEQSGVKTP